MNGSKYFFQLCNHPLSFCILINDFNANNLPWELKSDHEIIDYIFEKLKYAGFNFDYTTKDETGKIKGDNYGNYYLPRITLADFMLINPHEVLQNIETYIQGLLKRNADWYYQHRGEIFANKILTLIEYCVKSPKYCFELLVDTEKFPEKKHPVYTLYEHFKSFILFFNDDNKENVVYIEIGYA
jgi:hypothetical protein